MNERCPRCGLVFEREQGQFVGAVGINTIVSFLALLVTVVVGFVVTWPEPDAVKILIPTVVVAVVVPAVFFPMSKGIWAAVDLAIDPLGEDEAVDGPWQRPIEDEPTKS